MDDRELLELAAKAAGYRVHGWINDRLYVVDMSDPAENFDPFVWNPRDDDGDALRLAVKLGMDVCIEIYHPDTQKLVAETGVYSEAGAEIESHSDDPYAATRRAIVRAAAEIGKATASPPECTPARPAT